MDSVRFGRVLGVGARLAGKTLVEAVDAATSPDPSPNRSAQGGGLRQEGILPVQAAKERAVRQAQATSAGVRQGKKRFGEAAWGPFARASGVLWLEVTGVFFGLVALVGLDGMWLNRAALKWSTSSHDVHQHFMIGAIVVLVFGYFGSSSFSRAARRGRVNR